jgi:hypothetical protein
MAYHSFQPATWRDYTPLQGVRRTNRLMASEGQRKVLVHVPIELNVDLTTFPQTWSLFRDRVVAKSATW